MAGDTRVAVAVGQRDRFDRFAERADLVNLDQDAVGDALVDAALQSRGVGDEQVVANELHTIPELVGEQLPTFPIVFVTAVFDRADWVLVDPTGKEVDHSGRIELATVDGIGLFLRVIKLGGGDI